MLVLCLQLWVLFLGARHTFITAAETVIAEEIFEVESEYTSVALKTALAMQEWWKQSPSNLEQLTRFAHILFVRLNACFACSRSTLQLKKERLWGAYHR